MIDDRVTVEQLLAHRSGIGDYLDEDEVADKNDYVLTVPVHELATTEQFLAVLDGHPMKCEPGERFNYCNGGYVVLALLAERASGVAFHDLVEQRVCRPAAMTDTSFLRSDELPGRAAVGYLDDDGLRTNVLPPPGAGQRGRRHLHHRSRRPRPVGCDVRRADRLARHRREMMRPRSDVPEESMRYGLGFWLTPLPVPCPSTGSMPASGSSRSAIAITDSPTPSCPTRAAGHGQSVNASTSCSQHRRDHRQRGAAQPRSRCRRTRHTTFPAVVRIAGESPKTASPTAGHAPLCVAGAAASEADDCGGEGNDGHRRRDG